VKRKGEISVTQYKPAVEKKWLLLLAGVIWSGVGLMLCAMAMRWLAATHFGTAIALAAAGLGMALVAYWFGFSRLAQKNIRRINELPCKACIFAFQRWQSYVLIAFMIALGVTLRHSSFPKEELAVIYAAMGGALLLASFRYYASMQGD
jgi:ABC-type uncharacterized transport system permease subunit